MESFQFGEKLYISIHRLKEKKNVFNFMEEIFCRTPREADRDVITPFFRLQIDRTEYLLLKSLIICNPSEFRIIDIYFLC